MKTKTKTRRSKMKKLDIIVAILLVVGGLNWGLVGLFNVNLVAALFGTSVVATIVYTLVGFSALYQVMQVKSIQRRWAER
jgi:uncharacterized membrane protein YuzA (DUF378 family)